MSSKKIRQNKTKPTIVPGPNQYDQLFESRPFEEGSAVVDKGVANEIAAARMDYDKREAEERGERYDPKSKTKAVRKIPLEVVRTVFLDAKDWNLRTATVARMKHDPRVIFVLSTSDGWLFAGVKDDPLTAQNIIKNNVTYVLPSLIGEVVAEATNPVLGKLPLDKRVAPYMSALASDVDRTIQRAVKEAQREQRPSMEEGNSPPADAADELAARRGKKKSRAKRKGRR